MTSSRTTRAAIVLSVLILSCTDQRATDPDLPDPGIPAAPLGVVASNAPPALLTNGAASQSNGLTYVSASPGTFRDAASVRIRNRTIDGSAVTAMIRDGGFDPVAIRAAAGDELTLELDGASTTSIVAVKVPPRLPPRVVRTSPSKGRTDVALSVQIEVIFSEPLSKGSVSTGLILSSPTGSVPGHITLSDDGITAVFVPDSDLTPGTSYSLAINNTIVDLDGDSLEGGETLTFTTASDSSAPFAADRIAFVSSRDGDTEIYSSDANGANVVRLTRNAGYDGDIAWSPDGSRIAYVSASSNEDWPTATHDIYLMNADGSARTQLTTSGFAAHPTWSPDGRQIAYSYRNGGSPTSTGDIAIIDVDKGQASTRYLGLSAMGAAQPAWLPDGTRIAFLAKPGYYDWWQQVLTIKPDGSSIQTLIDASSGSSSAAGLTLSSINFSPSGNSFTVNYCRNNDALIACAGGSGIAVGSYPGGGLSYFPQRNVGSVWYAQWNATWSPDGNVLSFSRRLCSGCDAKVGYSSVTGADTGALIDRSWDPVWRPRQ